jgi:hypothetical protein
LRDEREASADPGGELGAHERRRPAAGIHQQQFLALLGVDCRRRKSERPPVGSDSISGNDAELLRHSDIRVTMRYAHLAPENVRAAVGVLGLIESRSGHGPHTPTIGGKKRTSVIF